MVVTRSLARKRRLKQWSPRDKGGIRKVEKRPLDMLPEEAWGLVFDKLSPEDLASCSNAGCSFQSWLEPKRTRFLAHKVLPLLNLTTAEKLKCRLVCRSWRDAVDLDCETKPLLNDEYMRYCFKPTENMEIWKARMLARPFPGANPFISRNVIFGCRGWELDRHVDADEARDFWNGVAELLELYGEHIWYIKLVYKATFNFDIIQQSHSMFRLIRQLPNLKTLSVFQQPSRIPENLLADPLPPLRLYRLEFPGYYFGEPMKIKLLQTCNSHTLEELKISIHTEFVRKGGSELLTTFHNLKRLEYYDRHWLGLHRLGAVAWPLRELTLHLQMKECSSSRKDNKMQSFSNLFHWVNKFERTLRNLTLSLDIERAQLGGRYDRKRNRDLRLRLPLLQNLIITMLVYVGGIFSLDFIEELKSLEELRLQMENQSFQRIATPKEVIRYGGYECRMLQSNVWEVLPKLKFMDLKDSLSHYVYRKPEQ